MPFDSIIGHALAIRILRSMLQAGQIPQAFIFSGIDGIGKRTAAAGFVKALNCREQGSDFCGQCPACRKIERRMHPDVVWVEPEKNGIRIDQIRSLQADLAFRPLEARYKAVIIDAADRLNLHAANCLLKTLEEPPEQTTLMLIAGSTAGMLPTVLSRCHRIHFAPLAPADVRQYLLANGVAQGQAEVLCTHAQGSIGRALMLHASAFLDVRRDMAAALAADAARHVDELLKLAQRAGTEAAGLSPVLEFLETWYRDLLLLQEGLAEALLYNHDIIDSLRSAARHETRGSVLNKMRKVQWLQHNAMLNVDMSLGLEALFMQCA